jgi:hypothetical protein
VENVAGVGSTRLEVDAVTTSRLGIYDTRTDRISRVRAISVNLLSVSLVNCSMLSVVWMKKKSQTTNMGCTAYRAMGSRANRSSW